MQSLNTKDIDYRFLVSIRSLVYNHSKYINDCLDGLVSQLTTFPFVILLVDDFSTDGTQNVISDYIHNNFSIISQEETSEAYVVFAKHNENENCFITSFFLKYNHRSLKKSKLTYLQKWRDTCKYEAICEGDDYWIAQDKLQEQVQFMESNTEYVLSHTSIIYNYEDIKKLIPSNDVTINNQLNNDGAVNPEHILDRYRIQPVSVLYRLDVHKDILESDNFLYKSKYFLMGDTQLWFGFAKKGKIHFIPKVMCVYRRNRGSVSNQKSMKSLFRFELSSNEMRYYISQNYDLSQDYNSRILKNYSDSLLKYKLLDRHFEPLFKIKQKHTFLKKIYFSCYLLMFFVGKNFFSNLRKKVSKSI